MTEHEAAVGDALSDAIRRAAQALMIKDVAGAWQALDDANAARTLREWDRLRGRDVPSEQLLAAKQAQLIADLRESMTRPPTVLWKR